MFSLCILAGCGDNTTAPVRLAGDTMGTTWNVSYIDEQSALAPEDVQQGIEAQLALVDASMSTYRPDSEISRFNAAAVDTAFAVSSEFYTVLSTALDVGQKSGGAYDVTVGPLVDLWGFGATGAIAEPPGQADIERLRSQIGQKNIRLDEQNHRIAKLSNLSLDFSSLAKGYAVDNVAQWLLAQGIKRYMVEVGGEIRLAGLSGRGDAWRIAVEQPENRLRSVAITMSLSDQAIATSGDYRNYFEMDGQHYSHSLDPRTGYPIVHDLVSVTVVNPSCMVADAWATALTVLGIEQATAVAQEQGLAVYFIRKVGSEFVHSHTPQFADYLSQPPH